VLHKCTIIQTLSRTIHYGASVLDKKETVREKSYRKQT
jgi:hypothetical protein